MTRPTQPFSRRTLLRGVGVTITLPWLESVPVWGADQTAPRRFAALFMANGINPRHWWAKGSGSQMELGKSLQSLEKLKTKINQMR